MGTAKRLLLFMLSGALIGDIAAMIVAPAIVAWFHSTTDPASLCNCVKNTRDTISSFVAAQLIGAAGGAVLLLIIGILLVRARGRHPPVQSPSASPPQ